MKIEKYWLNKKEKEENFVVLCDNTIYRLRTEYSNFNKIETELQTGILNKKFVGLPIRYLRSVDYKEDYNRIKIIYNTDSSEGVTISNTALRKEIFDYLKENTNPLNVETIQPNMFQRIKKPFFGFLLFSAILAYVLSIMNGLNAGYEYEIIGSGRRGGGGANIILGLAHLGLTKVLLIFSPFIGVTIYQMIQFNKDKSKTIRLEYR